MMSIELLQALARLHARAESAGWVVPHRILVDATQMKFSFACTAREDSLEQLLEDNGFVQYMREAVIAEEQTEPSPATDIWSLGCVLWECLAGKSPFASTTLRLTSLHITKRKFVSPLPECDADTRGFLEAFFQAQPSAAQLLALPFVDSLLRTHERLAKELAKLTQKQLDWLWAGVGRLTTSSPAESEAESAVELRAPEAEYEKQNSAEQTLGLVLLEKERLQAHVGELQQEIRSLQLQTARKQLESKQTNQNELLKTARTQRPASCTWTGCFTELMKCAADADVAGVSSNMAQAGATDKRGQTALMHAARCGSTDCAALLLGEAGLQNCDEHTALLIAASCGQTECARFLAQIPAERTGLSPLMVGALRGAVDEVEEQLEFLKQTCCGGWTALMLAASCGHAECVQLLLGEAGKTRSDGWTALMFSAQHGCFECAEMLLSEAGKSTLDGHTALMLAARNGHAACVELLLGEAGKTTRNCTTALMEAAWGGHHECAGLLLSEAGLADYDGWTALMIASAGGHLECVRLLLSEAGCATLDGQTALMFAASNGHAGCVQLLESVPVELEASINLDYSPRK